jgi:hypothetical protein
LRTGLKISRGKSPVSSSSSFGTATRWTISPVRRIDQFEVCSGQFDARNLERGRNHFLDQNRRFLRTPIPNKFSDSRIERWTDPPTLRN